MIWCRLFLIDCRLGDKPLMTHIYEICHKHKYVIFVSEDEFSMTMFKNGSLWQNEALLQEALTTCPSQAVIDSHVSRKLRHYTAVFELTSSGPSIYRHLSTNHIISVINDSFANSSMIFHMAVSRICHYVDNVAYLYLTKIIECEEAIVKDLTEYMASFKLVKSN